MVFSCVRGNSDINYAWAQGTSMSAPAAAGVAALIIQANGGPMTPAQVRARMSQSASGLGKPGQDEFYGFQEDKSGIRSLWGIEIPEHG